MPVVFVCGDDKVAREAAELVPGIETAAVKVGVARTAARLLAPDEAHRRIREGVERALSAERKPEPLRFDGMPMRVVFMKTEYCDRASRCPAVTRVDARTIDIEAPDYLTVYRTFLTVVDLAAGAARRVTGESRLSRWQARGEPSTVEPAGWCKIGDRMRM